MNRYHLARVFVALFVFSAFLVSAALVANAATYTWTGGGGDDLWTNPSNWGGTAPVSGDTGRFTSTGGGGDIDTGSATDTWGVTLDSGADGYSILGSGTLSGPFAYNTSGTNTLSTTITASNNFALTGGGTLTIANGGRLTRGDTMSLNNATVTVQSGGQFGGLQSDGSTADRLRIESASGTNVVNIEAGGLLGLRNRLHMTGGNSNFTTINNSGLMTVLEIELNNDNKRLLINDGGETEVTRVASGGLLKEGGDGTIDMWTSNATLALRGGDATVDTLPEFYALTGGGVGMDGNDFRYWDGASYVTFDSMTGSDWYTITHDTDYKGTGQAYTILQTQAIPEPTTLALGCFGLLGLLCCRRRRR